MAETSRAQRVRQIAETWPGISAIVGQSRPRNVRGSSQRSEHTWGNALDIYGTKAALSSLGYQLDTQRQSLAISTLCYDGGTYSFDRCTTAHIDHLHVDFSPHCAGAVSDSGSGEQRATACNDFQGSGMTQQPGQGGQPPGNFDPTPGGGFDPLGLDKLGGVLQDIATRGLWVFLGAMAITAGIVFMVKDTTAFKALQGAAIKATTKGVI